MTTSAIIDFRSATPYWVARREVTLNWLALGLLLAAWNAADNGLPEALSKPGSLRIHPQVSVRAVQRATTQART